MENALLEARGNELVQFVDGFGTNVSLSCSTTSALVAI